ncbi:MAG: carbohydrate binding family 9 domain-containing protein [Chitinophagaceae bacterium]|nr:carbohydrate binding family 9 domain-containing protein [Chitinophagaceae bacterium]
MKLSLFIFLVLFNGYNIFAQNVDSANKIQKDYQLIIKKTESAVKVDGKLDEAIWQTADKATNFWQKWPQDKLKAARNTMAQVAYDDEFLYIAFTVDDIGKPVIQSLKRDFGHDGQDGVAVVIDPLNLHTNGLFFVVNAFNSQSEDLLSPNGNSNWSWDNKWFSATQHNANGWTAEMAIPFKTLRYDALKQNWGINFIRVDTKSNEYSCWTPVPVNFASHDLGYTGVLQWKEKPPKPGSNIVIQPYITASVDENKQFNEPLKAYGNAGFDSKIALSSSLNLDITVNPDFSQVDVDRQVTNLSRFNIFFPERRTFFLENSDLLSNFGIPPIRPFYSRRIGVDGNGNRVPILLGARLSGNLSKKTRIGLMNVQTGNTDTYAAENYSAVSVSQRVLKRSSISGYFLNRQAFLNDQQKKADPILEFGRNSGLSFEYTNLKGNWNGWASIHQSYKPNIKGENNFYGIGYQYSGRTFGNLIDFDKVGENYYTDIGFVNRISNYDAIRDTSIRVGFKQLYTETYFKIFPTKGNINVHNFDLNTFFVWNPDNSINELEFNMSYSLNFKNTSSIRIFGNAYQANLLFPISFTGGRPIPAQHYEYVNYGMQYRSDFRKDFSYSGRFRIGQFYNADYNQFSVDLTYRKQPHFNFSVNIEFNKLNFPDDYGSRELFLISPRIEYNFTTNLFWTTFMQYNTQSNNYNINSRLQWRYKPMSDLFLVYTDNYFTNPFLQNKNRALVFKMNYWLNL